MCARSEDISFLVFVLCQLLAVKIQSLVFVGIEISSNDAAGDSKYENTNHKDYHWVINATIWSSQDKSICAVTSGQSFSFVLLSSSTTQK